MSLILKNTRAVCLDGIKECDIKIDGGVISRLCADIAVGDGDEVVECNGATVMPGFIDTHMHGAYGCRINDTDCNVSVITEFEAKQGVTGIAASTATSEFPKLLTQLKIAKEAISTAKGAKILGIHAEGPFLSLEYKGAMHFEHILPPSVEKLDEMIEASGNNIKILTVAPEKECMLELIEYAVSRGIKVSMGHTNATHDEAKAAICAGASQMTHTFNAARPINHREPGVLGVALTDDRVKCEMICDFVHLHPTTLMLIYRAKGADKINMISDSGNAAGLDIEEFEVEGVKRYIKDGVVRLADGTIAGSAKTLYDGVKNMASLGVPLVDIAKMASYNPAQSLGVEDKVGSIEVGKAADLVILDGDMNLLSVYIDGEKV